MVSKDMSKMLDSLGKRYGEKRVNIYDKPKVTSTGSLALDFALQTGGWPQGRIIEISGIPNVGKSSICLASLAEQQKKWPDKAVCYIDMEATFDPEWAENFGVDLDPERFTLVHPDDSEDVSDAIKMTASSGLYSCLVIDSIGAMESRQALSKNADEHTVGRNAQVITRMLKNAVTQARKNQVTILLINQLRANIGSMSGMDVSAGPKALAYTNSMKVMVRRGGEPPLKLREDGQEIQVGHQVKVKVEKNKLGLQGRIAEFYLITHTTDKYGPVGIDVVDETVSAGLISGAIERGGAWYNLPNGDRFQGRDKVEAALRENDELLYSVREKALSLIGEGNDEVDTEVFVGE